MSLLDTFSDSSTVLLVINSILYSKHVTSKSLVYRYFSIYLILMAINQLANTILFEFEIHNIFLSNTYLIVQFFMLSLFYYEMFRVKQQRKYILIVMSVLLIILGVQYIWTPDLFWQYNPFGVITTSSVLIFYSIIYFFYHISDKQLRLYLVNSGILIYLLGTILLFSIAKVGLKLDPDIEIALWILNAIIFLVFQVIITAQWFVDRKKEKNKLN